MPRLSVLAVAVLSSLAVSAVASSALADAAAGRAAPAQPGCFVSLLAGTSGATTSLPSNAPALILTDSSHGGAVATVTAELVTGAERVAFVGPTKDTHGLTVLQFVNPSAGSHTIATKVDCSEGEDKTFDTAIVLTAPVTFPKSVGALSIRASSPPKGFDQIDLTATPELRAFLPVSVLKVSVNGQPAIGLANSAQPGSSAVSFNAHTGGVCVENGSLHREKRTVKISVSADIAGVADSPAPAILDVVVDCGAIRWTSPSDFESSKPGSPTTTTPVSPDGKPTTTTGGTDAGCTAAPVGTLSGNAAALVAGALVVVAGLRRRRRAA